jgi:hypothetical protein
MKSFLFLILIIYSFTVSAQWTADTTINTIVRDTLEATTPLEASAGNGFTYISWFEMNNSNYELHMQLLDSSGFKQWPIEGITISSYPQNSALFTYDLKTDHEGNAIVAFQDERTGVLNVVVYKIASDGSFLWGTDGIVLIDSTADQGISPAIGITEQNDVVVAWMADSSSDKWICAQRITSSGFAIWNPLYRIKDNIGNLKYSRQKLFPSGSDDMQILFVEENGNYPFAISTLYTQRIHSNGSNFFPSALMVSTKTIPYFFFPQPVPDDNGGFYLAFNTSNPVNISMNDVYVQYVDYNGTLWNPEGFEAANSVINHKSTPSACYVSASSEFWVLLQVLDGSQGSSGVSVQKFDALGNKLLGQDGQNIIPVDPIYYNPNTITNTHDGLILTVTYGLFGDQHIEAIKLAYSAMQLWANSISLCAVNSNKDDVQSGDFFNNNLVIVWQDDRNGSGIFAQNITADGTLGTTVGIQELFEKNNFILFPNPSSSPEIIFENTSQKKIVFINDALGKELKRMEILSGSSHVPIDADELPGGIYFITVLDDARVYNVRWVKN